MRSGWAGQFAPDFRPGIRFRLQRERKSSGERRLLNHNTEVMLFFVFYLIVAALQPKFDNSLPIFVFKDN
jgi:hypothetical protein